MAVEGGMNALDAFISNEGELRQVFEGKSTERNKDVMRNQHKKNTFLNELVHIKLNDDFGHLVEEWKIVRRRISLEKIQTMIKRTAMPEVEIDFFYDNTGVPIWMDDLLLKSTKMPNFYTIVPQVKRYPSDVRENPRYEGQTFFVIKQVPLKSKDETQLVDEAAMREWMHYAITEEDPHAIPLKKRLGPLEDLIKEIDKKIKGVSKMTFFDEDDNAMDDDKAEEEREFIYNQFGEDRLKAEKKLKKYEISLESHILWRKSMGMDLHMEEVDENTQTSTWRIRFFGHNDALEMEDLLIKKDNWSGIRMATGSPAFEGKPKIPPFACRGPLPDGTNVLLPNYSGLAVNVAGARFFRIPHGVGAIKTLDRSNTTIASDQFGVYYGRFELGQKTGTAFEMDDVSVYSGKYLHNHRKGKGRLDYADGTTILGDFNVHLQSDNKVSLTFDNPYVGGEPNGEAEILFGDGGMYKGKMHNGQIHGQGEYQSAFGEIMIGHFEQGVLHGPDGYRKNHSGEKWKGEWDYGEVDGFAKYENERGDTYEGYWDHTLRHGRGVAKYSKLGRYRGYFVNGTRNGKGEMEFGLRPKKKKPKKKTEEEEEKEERKKGIGGKGKGVEEEKDDGKKEATETETLDSEFLRIYQGYFLSGHITNGGIVMNLDSQTPSVISRRDKKKLIPITNVFEQNERNIKRLQRQVEKFNDMEQFMRKEIVDKKYKIFRQQRHYTKKSMYQTDTWGGFPQSDLDSRAVVRERRLKKVDESILRPKNARVPVLQTVDIHPMQHLTQIYDYIKPDPGDGRTDRVKTMFLQAAVSDYEEVVERQRYLKYDNIWKRAESHFITKKREAKLAGEGGD